MAPAPPTQWLGISDVGRTYLTVSTILTSIAFVCVLLRIWARIRQYGRLFADDYFSIAAQVFAFALMSVSILIATQGGLGYHILDLPPLQGERFLQLFYAAELLYTICGSCYKLAVLFLYKRIFGEVRSFNICAWILVAMSIGWGVGGVVSSIFQCTPVEKAWEPLLPGHCIDTKKLIQGNGISNLLIDAAILLLPVPVVWRLQLTTSKKLALTGMFLLGSVVLVASIVRVTTLLSINLLDPTWTVVNVAIWSEVEPALGIIGACLPTLRQFLWKKISKSYASRPYGSRSRKYVVSSDNPTGSDSTAKSNIAIALTGWSDTDNYTEIKGSHPQTPRSADPEYLAAEYDHNYSREMSHEHGADDRSIFVTTEVSVGHD